jgi:hypothetical protein
VATRYPLPQGLIDEHGGSEEEARAFVASLGVRQQTRERVLALADAEPDMDVYELHAHLAIVQGVHAGPGKIAYILQEDGR